MKSWFVVLSFLCEPPPPPPQNPPAVGSEGATRCWKANLGDRHFVKSLASRRLWVVPGLRAKHRQADRTLPTLSTKTWCSSKRGVLGFGVYARCVGVQVQRCLRLFRFGVGVG